MKKDYCRRRGEELSVNKIKIVNRGENTANGGRNTMNERGIFVNGDRNNVDGGGNIVIKGGGIMRIEENICE